MKIAQLTVVLLVVSTGVLADEVAPPPITRETLVGVWEAAPPWGNCVYRLEVNKTGPSYLAFTIFGFENLVYRMTSSHIKNGKFTLEFECMSDRQNMGSPKGGGPEMNHLTISGQGNAGDVSGVFQGSLRMKLRSFDDVESEPVAFRKPPWVEQAAIWSKRSEELIRNAKSDQ